jgi:hypothetical protein
MPRRQEDHVQKGAARLFPALTAGRAGGLHNERRRRVGPAAGEWVYADEASAEWDRQAKTAAAVACARRLTGRVKRASKVVVCRETSATEDLLIRSH